MGTGHTGHSNYQVHSSHRLSAADLKWYLLIFLFLTFSTILQIILKNHLAVAINVYFQIIISLIKVVFVALFFMHLKEESLWLKFIAAIPLFAVLYTVFITVESIIR